VGSLLDLSGGAVFGGFAVLEDEQVGDVGDWLDVFELHGWVQDCAVVMDFYIKLLKSLIMINRIFQT